MEKMRNGVCVNSIRESTVKQESDLQSAICSLNEAIGKNQTPELSRALQKIAKLAESKGQPQICLGAQGISELLSHHTGDIESLSSRLELMIADLKSKLSYWDWKTQKIETESDLF